MKETETHLACLPLLASLVTCALATSSLVLPPVRPSGPEVALVFVPGASIKGEAYEATARAIQAASPIRLWVALTGNYSLNTPNPLELPGAMAGAFKALQAAGMKGDNYIGAAHSLGGVFLGPWAKSSPLKGVVLMGSYLTKGNALSDYPLPLLTLSGELDGQARITRIAVPYAELVPYYPDPPSDAIYKTPVINIKGMCHAQFASGKMPSAVVKYDLQPEITEEQAHAQIGLHVSSFITTNFGIGNVTQAKQNLSQAFHDSGDRFGPLLDVKDLDNPMDRRAPWPVYAQQQISLNLDTMIAVSNYLETNPAFLSSTPKITNTGSSPAPVDIEVHNLIAYPLNPIDISTIPESPQEIDIKMFTYDAIKSALKNTSLVVVNSSNFTTCKDLNLLALTTALQSSSSDAQRRYNASGRPIILEDDTEYSSTFQWDSTALGLDEQDDGLHVRGVALKTSVNSSVLPGVFYCKLMSPYRAMEWINVDSLRKHKPSSGFHFGK